MKRWIIPTIIAVVLSGCGGSVSTPSVPPPSAYQPTSPLWQMRDGSWAEYLILRGTGRFDPTTGCIDIDPSTFTPGETNRTTTLAYQMAAGPSAVRIYSPAAIPVTSVDANLAQGLAERSTGVFIGESANYGAADQDPPEPLLMIEPIAGEVLEVTSAITTWDGAKFPFKTRYHTKAVGVEIDGFHNATVTCLVEQPEKPNPGVYVQVYDGGDDMAEQWAGVVKDDGTVDVVMGRRVRVGRN